MNFNPFQIIQAIKGGTNPEQIVTAIVQQRFGSTPMGKNIMSLTQAKDPKGLEELAKNMCSQKGIDYDSAFNSFKNNLGIK